MGSVPTGVRLGLKDRPLGEGEREYMEGFHDGVKHAEAEAAKKEAAKKEAAKK